MGIKDGIKELINNIKKWRNNNKYLPKGEESNTRENVEEPTDNSFKNKYIEKETIKKTIDDEAQTRRNNKIFSNLNKYQDIINRINSNEKLGSKITNYSDTFKIKIQEIENYFSEKGLNLDNQRLVNRDNTIRVIISKLGTEIINDLLKLKKEIEMQTVKTENSYMDKNSIEKNVYDLNNLIGILDKYDLDYKIPEVLKEYYKTTKINERFKNKIFKEYIPLELQRLGFNYRISKEDEFIVEKIRPKRKEKQDNKGQNENEK